MSKKEIFEILGNKIKFGQSVEASFSVAKSQNRFKVYRE